MKRLSALVAVLLVAGLLAACGGGGGGGATPEGAAKAFMEAMFSGKKDQLKALVCQDLQSEMSTLEQAADTISQLGAKVDLSGLQYKATSTGADTADVTVSGTIKLSILGVSQDQDLGSETVQMKREGGGWKVCGGATIP